MSLPEIVPSYNCTPVWATSVRLCLQRKKKKKRKKKRKKMPVVRNILENKSKKVGNLALQVDNSREFWSLSLHASGWHSDLNPFSYPAGEANRQVNKPDPARVSHRAAQETVKNPER